MDGEFIGRWIAFLATPLITLAYQLAGLVPDGGTPDAGQMSKGDNILNVRFKALQNQGIILRMLTQQTFPLTAAVATYAMPASAIDIDTKRPFVTSNGGTNVPLEWWSRDMYMSLTQPSTTGQPTSIYVEKTPTITVYLYPVPDGTWPTMTLPVISALADLNVDTDLSGLQSKYLETLVTMVASWLALGAGLLPRHQMLERQYENAVELATNDDTERGNIRFMPDYGYAGYGSGRRVL